jgi:hypothetical protein
MEMTKKRLYTTKACIEFWEKLIEQIESGERPKFFSDSYQDEEMIRYCNKMIEKNKEDL